MSEVILFVSKAERERARLVREARAIYDSIFPPDFAAAKQQGDITAGRTTKDSKSSREGGLS
jgi:hypothetical protein